MEHKSKALVDLLRTKGIANEAVLTAIATTSRADFVEQGMEGFAYSDEALPIGFGQTISQPFVVACMTELMLGDRESLGKVLEIGTGSGYQAAILSQLADQVYTIERIKSLADRSQTRLEKWGYDNVVCHYGDGFLGWPEKGPYDGIIVTAAAPEVPQPLLEQMAEGARMVIPVGERADIQILKLIVRRGQAYDTQDFDPVVFVPMLPGKE